MSEWKDYKVEEFAEVIGGGTPKTDIPEYWNGTIPWITPRDLTNFKNKYIKHGERFITLKGLEKSNAKILPSGTVLLSSRAPIGYLAIAENELTTNQGFQNLIPKTNVDSEFLYYLLKNNVDYLISQGSGTTFAELSKSTLKKIKFKLPPLPEQKAIAEVLSSLDDKIDLLHRQNETLEQLAETLFRQWFLEEKCNGSLNEYIKVQNGYAFKSKDFKVNGYAGVIKIKNISMGSIDITNHDCVDESVVKNIDKKFKIKSGDFLIAMTGAEIGKIGIVEITDKEIYINQRVGKLDAKVQYGDLIGYFALKSTEGQEHIMNVCAGSAQENISAAGIEEMSFSSYNEQKVNSLGIQIQPLYQMIIFNKGQIRTLTQIRDTQMSKLMSGDVFLN
ncbi:MAG: restriction endonuclease subunit S [Ignavibacteria bacterium]|nr:restriction endonuclease subunit S [Ignavibacteria bacterium]